MTTVKHGQQNVDADEFECGCTKNLTVLAPKHLDALEQQHDMKLVDGAIRFNNEDACENFKHIVVKHFDTILGDAMRNTTADAIPLLMKGKFVKEFCNATEQIVGKDEN